MQMEAQMYFTPIGPTSDREVPITSFPERQDYEQFYTAYGECFSAWSNVEINLLSIFIFLLQSPTYEAAASVFYSTTGFRAKLDLVDALVKSSKQSDKELHDNWNTLREKTIRHSRCRNQLAHNTVFYGRESANEKRKLFIGNPQLPYCKSRLHIHDLKEIKVTFSLLAKELNFFWQGLIHDHKDT